MQLSLSLSRRGASSLAAALCLDSCRDLSTARCRCFTWGRRGENRIHGCLFHFVGASEEKQEEKGSYQGVDSGEEKG